MANANLTMMPPSPWQMNRNFLPGRSNNFWRRSMAVSHTGDLLPAQVTAESYPYDKMDALEFCLASQSRSHEKLEGDFHEETALPPKP